MGAVGEDSAGSPAASGKACSRRARRAVTGSGARWCAVRQGGGGQRCKGIWQFTRRRGPKQAAALPSASPRRCRRHTLARNDVAARRPPLPPPSGSLPPLLLDATRPPSSCCRRRSPPPAWPAARAPARSSGALASLLPVFCRLPVHHRLNQSPAALVISCGSIPPPSAASLGFAATACFGGPPATGPRRFQGERRLKSGLLQPWRETCDLTSPGPRVPVRLAGAGRASRRLLHRPPGWPAAESSALHHRVGKLPSPPHPARTPNIALLPHLRPEPAGHTVLICFLAMRRRVRLAAACRAR